MIQSFKENTSLKSFRLITQKIFNEDIIELIS